MAKFIIGQRITNYKRTEEKRSIEQETFLIYQDCPWSKWQLLTDFGDAYKAGDVFNWCKVSLKERIKIPFDTGFHVVSFERFAPQDIVVMLKEYLSSRSKAANAT
jgi:hypothetical protein